MKHTIITAIITILTAALFFCAGMHHAITHMTIEADASGTNTAIVTLDEKGKFLAVRKD